jgi:hypothetical protein
MSRVIGQRWEIYDYETVKNTVLKKGEFVVVKNTPDYGKAAIKLHSRASNLTIKTLYDEWKSAEETPYASKKALNEGLGTLLMYTDDNKVDKKEKAVANGVATLDENGTVPASQLPSANGLLAVATDKSLKGNGTPEHPLKINFPLFIKDNVAAQTGTPQVITIPVTGDYIITARGAAGIEADSRNRPANSGYKGGKGAKISAKFHFNAGDVITIIVGKMGVRVDASTAPSDGVGGMGGGGTFVFKNIPAVTDSRYQFTKDGQAFEVLLVAAGGGGTTDLNYSTAPLKGEDGVGNTWYSPSNYKAPNTTTFSASGTSAIGGSIQQYITNNSVGAYSSRNGATGRGGYGGGGVADDSRSSGGGWFCDATTAYSWSNGSDTAGFTGINEGNGSFSLVEDTEGTRAVEAMIRNLIDNLVKNASKADRDNEYPIGDIVIQLPSQAEPNGRLPGTWVKWNDRPELYGLIATASFPTTSAYSETDTAAVAAGAYRTVTLKDGDVMIYRLIAAKPAGEAFGEFNPVKWDEIGKALGIWSESNTSGQIRFVARNKIAGHTWSASTSTDHAVGATVTFNGTSYRVVARHNLGGKFLSGAGGNRPPFEGGGVYGDVQRPVEGRFVGGHPYSPWESSGQIPTALFASQAMTLSIASGSGWNFQLYKFFNGAVIPVGNENAPRNFSVQWWRRIA